MIQKLRATDDVNDIVRLVVHSIDTRAAVLWFDRTCTSAQRRCCRVQRISPRHWKERVLHCSALLPLEYHVLTANGLLKQVMDLETPAMIVDLSAFRTNVELMRNRIKARGIDWRPPVKVLLLWLCWGLLWSRHWHSGP